MKRVLGIFAHREDHIVCGWPVFQNMEIERHLIVCTNDAEVLVQMSCESYGIIYHGSIGLQNGFAYDRKRGLPWFSESIERVVSETLSKVNPDAIFTHNPWGEYGHFDHRFVFECIFNKFRAWDVMLSSIVATSTHYPAAWAQPRQFETMMLQSSSERVEPDYEFYRAQAELFERHKMWTSNVYLNAPRYPHATTLHTIKGEDE